MRLGGRQMGTGAAIYLTEVAGKYGDAWISFLVIGAKTRLFAVGS